MAKGIPKLAYKRRCEYCCKAHVWYTTWAQCRRRYDRRRARRDAMDRAAQAIRAKS